LAALLTTPVEVSSKRVQRALDSPQAVEVITAEQIRASGAFRLADVLRLATGVQVWDGDPDRANVTIRGVNPAGNPRTVQVLIDGVPMFNIVAGPLDLNGLPVPVDAIDRIEIVRGPSSSLYGANAQLGVIAITTKRAREGVEGSLRAGAGEHGATREQGFFSYGAPSFSITAGLAAQENGELHRPLSLLGDARTVPQNTRSRALQAFLRPQWVLGGARFWAALGYGDSGHTDQTSFAPDTLAPVVVFPNLSVTRELLQAGWAQAWGPTLRTELKVGQKTLRLGLDPLEAVPANPASPGILASLLATDPAMGTSHDFYFDRVRETSLQVNWDPSDAFHLVAGADAKVIATGENRTLGLAEACSLSASGGFLSLDWTLGRATLSLGARGSREDLGGASTSPRASVVWSLDESSVLRLGCFTSTRSPMVQERDNLVADSPVVTQLYIPNPGLRPERVMDLEGGYRKAGNGWSLDITLFTMEIHDLIANTPTLNPAAGKTVTQWTNASSIFRDNGVEVAFSCELAQGWGAGFNGATAAFKDPIYGQDRQADYAPSAQATLWSRYRRGRCFAYGALQHVASYTVSNAGGGTAAHRTMPAALQAHFNVGFEPRPGVSISLYGLNAARPATGVSNAALLNGFALRYTRRELGVQAEWRF
jgi:iron complex outermembrane receptor protein